MRSAGDNTVRSRDKRPERLGDMITRIWMRGVAMVESLRDEPGQGMLEYAILLTTLVGIVTGGLLIFGGAITAALSGLAGQL